MSNSIYKHIVLYLAITFGFTWALWGSQALYVNDIYTNQPVELLAHYHSFGAWGPLIAAIIIAFIAHGKKGVMSLVKRTLNLSFSKKWLVPVFLLFPCIVGAPLVILYLFNQPLPQFPEMSILIAFIAFFIILFTSGPLQEEYGWRGTLQEQLQNKICPLKASIVTGFIWGIWHLPLFYIPDQGFYYDKPIWGLVFSTTLISILFTWIYNNTQKNMLLMLIFHAMWNFSHYVFPTINSDVGGQIYFVLIVLVVVAVVVKDREIFLR